MMSQTKETRSPWRDADGGKSEGRRAGRCTEVLRAGVARAENLIGQHPGTALGASFLIGVVAAWWIKRR